MAHTAPTQTEMLAQRCSKWRFRELGAVNYGIYVKQNLFPTFL